MELWGGVECTVNRVGDRYRDQVRLSGHQDRGDDLARIAELGIRTLRFGLPWERVAPDAPGQYDWRWSDDRLAECARLELRPILGLLHHGSGPRYTSLVDPGFPALFEDYAGAAAARYPHIADWTPVNEPLTTARFSALYGHWYPHAKDERSFWMALLNQVDATRRAMRAIRRVIPRARLIQTEDLGETWATEPLQCVAEYYNTRRWLSWDLLAGRVDQAHPLWEEGVAHGFADRLRAIRDDPCPPDVIGVNHYPTSERFLDHRVELHGPTPAAGYHDLTALRVLDPHPGGLGALLRQAWERYRTPLAVTECHLGCTREEQMRWLWQSWAACEALARDGVDVRALTLWALFGSVDWDSLLTVAADHYEPGAFDVRGGQPRPTALAAIARVLTGVGGAGDTHHAELARMPGWWRRPVRLEHAPVRLAAASVRPREVSAARPILITGANGMLGQAFAGACRLRGLPHVLTDRVTLPIDDGDRVAALLDHHRPWAVVNAAGWREVDAADDWEAACMAANADGAGVLAEACAARGVHCTIVSSHLVFDGRQDAPYLEQDEPAPLSAYGRSKAGGEQRALAAGALVVRTAALFGPYDDRNFAVAVERSLRVGRRFLASDAHVVTPTYTPDLVRACLDLAIDGERGLWHLSQGEPLSWFAFARRVAEALDLDPRLIVAATPEALGWRALRPRQSALATARGALLPSLDDALARHSGVRRSAWAVEPARSAAA